MIVVSKTLKNSLWEYNTEKLKYSDDIVILRALCFGEIEDIKTILGHTGKEKIIFILQKYKNQIDNKSMNFWHLYFHIQDHHILSNKSMYDKLNTPTFTRSFR